MARHHIALNPGADITGFRDAARRLLESRIPPEHVTWDARGGTSLFGEEATGHAAVPMLPRCVVELIQDAVCHRDPERYALCYMLLWRVHRGERALLEVASDSLVHRLLMLRKAVRRDIHKMHAFLRFRDAGSGRFIAWFETGHFILEAASPFFVERFGSLVWSIVTPIGSLHWDRETLAVGEAGRRADVPTDDAFEAAWRDYYESIFNPARVNPVAMRQHMPKKYWRNMPETAAIPHLLREATARVDAMVREKPEPGGQRKAQSDPRSAPRTAIRVRGCPVIIRTEANGAVGPINPGRSDTNSWTGRHVGSVKVVTPGLEPRICRSGTNIEESSIDGPQLIVGSSPRTTTVTDPMSRSFQRLV